MEHIPKDNEILNEQIILAETLFDAVNKRDNFVQSQGGLDNIYDLAWFNGEEIRKSFEQLQEQVTNARKEFDEKVTNKEEFVRSANERGHHSAADLIKKMFIDSKLTKSEGGIFSRFFKK